MQPEENNQPEAAPEQMVLEVAAAARPESDTQLRALVEAIVYVAEEPVTAAQIAPVAGWPEESIRQALAQLASEYDAPDRGLAIREVAGGFKIGTKPEHHEAVRAFARSLKPALKLSLAALETLAVIAYKQPITAPEIMAIRGVQGAGVLKTLLERKLIATSGRKQVVGRPILYRTTKDFLLQFGLKDLGELPTLKEFEDLRRLALGDEEQTPVEERETQAGMPAPPEETQAGMPIPPPAENG